MPGQHISRAQGPEHSERATAPLNIMVAGLKGRILPAAEESKENPPRPLSTASNNGDRSPSRNLSVIIF